MAAPSLKLPIGTRAAGAADPAEVAKMASPLRRRGGCAPKLSPATVDSTPAIRPPAATPGAPSKAVCGSPTSSPGSYREQLRANGLGALQRSRAASGKLTPGQATQSPTPGSSLTFFPPPPSFVPLASAVQDAGGRPLLQLELPPADASARSPPAYAQPFLPVGPPTPVHAMAALPAAPVLQACGWPDMSPIAAGSPCASQTTIAFFDQLQAPVASVDLQLQTPIAPTDLQGFGAAPDLMAIAMPQAAASAMDREQIAAQLRAAAPESYED